MNNVNIEIDGQQLQVPQGSMVIEAADKAGIPIPRFCYHKKLSIAANCRMCLVQVENAPKALPACATPVSEGMKIHTKSAITKEAQKAVMEFLLINHPLDCPICDQGGQCELQDVAMEYGKDFSRFEEGKRSVAVEDIGPLIQTEMTRCIQCTRCVRFGDEVAGLRELGATGRGEHMQIGTYIEHSVSSELSGNVIELCPVGALTSKPFRFKARAWEIFARSGIGQHDPLGSNLYHHTYEDKVVRTVPREHEDINEVWLSDRDRFGYEGLQSKDRLLSPEIRENGVWKKISWEQALLYTVERLQYVKHKIGPESIGAVASPNCTLEEHYLLQKIMRALGTDHVDHRLRVQDVSMQEAHDLYPRLNQTLSQFEDNKIIFLIGAHPRTEAPLLNQRILKATQKGAEVLSLQTHRDEHRYPIALETFVEKGDFVGFLTQTMLALCKSLDKPVPKVLGSTMPTDDRAICLALKLQEQGSKILLLGHAALSHPKADTIQALARMIAELVGANTGELTEGANSAGAWLAGMVPHRGAAGKKVKTPGLSYVEMLNIAPKAMVLMNIEPEFDGIDPVLSRKVFEKMDEVICITPFVTPQMRSYANLLLPMVPVPETDGTFVNMLGDWQSFKAAVKPKGEARPAWKILRVLGNMLHLEGFEQNHAREVKEELRGLVESMPFTITPFEKVGPLDLNSEVTGSIRLAPVAMYSSNNVVRRSEPLQNTTESKLPSSIVINPAMVSAAWDQVSEVRLVHEGEVTRATFKVKLDETLPVGSILVYAGTDKTIDLGAPFATLEIEWA